MTENVLKVIEQIASEIVAFAQALMADSKMGLRDSDLRKNVDVDIATDGGSVVINMLFDNYIQYLEEGRAPRQGKQPPIDQLRDWALKRGIPTDNSTLFLISRAIWRDGQKPRPILATIEQEIDRLWETEWSDMIFDAITEEFMNQLAD